MAIPIRATQATADQSLGQEDRDAKTDRKNRDQHRDERGHQRAVHRTEAAPKNRRIGQNGAQRCVHRKRGTILFSFAGHAPTTQAREMMPPKDEQDRNRTRPG